MTELEIQALVLEKTKQELHSLIENRKVGETLVVNAPAIIATLIKDLDKLIAEKEQEEVQE